MTQPKQKKNIQAIYRLTPVQEGMLYHSIKSPNSGFYFQQFSCELGQLDAPQKWQQAWQNVCAKHPIMRTFFTWEKRERPLQVVREKVSLPWVTLDWSTLSEAQVAAQWAQFKELDRQKPFDLTQAPLARFTLIHLKQNRYLFLLSFHHIILDGWSQLLLFDEALSQYRCGLSESNQNDAPTFQNFVQWYEAQDHGLSLKYWTDFLKGFDKPTNIPKNPQAIGHGSAAQTLSLDASDFKALKNIAQQHHITLNSMLLGAMAIMLATETRETDVVFGTTVAGRPADFPGIEHTAGMFINTVPMRAQVSGELTLASWLKSLQSKQTSSFPYVQTALNEIQNKSAVEQGKALFDTILVVENLPISDKGQHLDPVVSNRQYDQFSHYQLAILVDPTDGLKLHALHQRDYICEQKAQDILALLRVLLVQMSKNLQQRVSDLSLRTEDNQPQLINGSTFTPLMENNLTGIHQYFEKHVDSHAQKDTHKMAHKAALVTYSALGEQRLSYQQFNAKANQLAQFLINKGCKQGSLVAVLMDKSAQALIAFLAVLKTGAAYIPMDTSHPTRRIMSVLEDIKHDPHFILTQTNTTISFSEHCQNVLYVDKLADEISRCETHNPNVKIDPKQLAYIIYTSGSTGKPKGVMIEHGALINSTLARDVYYSSNPEVFLLLSSLATDSSIAGIYWSLCTGHTLVLPPHRAEQDLTNLSTILEHNAVTHLLCIPNLYQLILENCRIESLSSLNTVIVAGEACPAKVIEQHNITLANASLYNEYGPTEYTVWATVSDLTKWRRGELVTIGTPIANTQIYVLNADKVAVPQGVVGELYVGGLSLARGYYKQPEKTKEAFVSNPYFQQEQINSPKLLYRTGDLVRQVEHGNLEFIGRADNQLKVRGFRIEPEEVEAVLNQHPQVKDSVVFLKQEFNWNGDIEELALKLSEMNQNQVENLLEQAKMLTDQI